MRYECSGFENARLELAKKIESHLARLADIQEKIYLIEKSKTEKENNIPPLIRNKSDFFLLGRVDISNSISFSEKGVKA